MGAPIFLALTAAAIAVLGLLVAMGYRAAPPLAALHPTHSAAERQFAAAPEIVADAYRRAAMRTPGMRVIEYGPRMLYLDSRPNRHIFSGAFGLLLLLTFDSNETDSGDGPMTTRVITRVRGKSFAMPGARSVAEVEQAVRVRVRRFGIVELEPADRRPEQP